jgi:toxin ParE1/3/4
VTRQGIAVTRRPKADDDILSAVLWLRKNGSLRVAEEFVVALEAAVRPLRDHPLAGTDLIGTRLGIPGLRSYRVAGTAYLLFYSAAPGQLEIIRVLHERRDIDADLLES